VAAVRHSREKDPALYDSLFSSMGTITMSARRAMAHGDLALLGSLMNENQKLLTAIGVSSPENDRLVQAAIIAGAPGAKLTGGGMGGNVIVMAPPELETGLEQALLSAGATACYRTEVAS